MCELSDLGSGCACGPMTCTQSRTKGYAGFAKTPTVGGAAGAFARPRAPHCGCVPQLARGAARGRVWCSLREAWRAVSLPNLDIT